MEFFELLLPLPFRAAFTIVIGVWCYAYDLWCLDRNKNKIDAPSLLRLPPRANSAQPNYHKAVQRFAIVLTVPLAVLILLFWILTAFDEEAVSSWHWIATGYLGFLLAAFFFKGHFISTLGRVLVGGIGEKDSTKFRDILLADVLCSYAKVLGDVTLIIIALLNGTSPTGRISNNVLTTLVLAAVNFLPNGIRMIQCATVYGRAGEGSRLDFLNFLKYATSIPPIFIGAVRTAGGEAAVLGMEPSTATVLWYASLVLNSGYSLYWDIAHDWDLTVFDPSARERTGMPWGLRPNRYWMSDWTYYNCIVVDCMFRFIWTVKLMGRRGQVLTDMQLGIWILELIEVIRRAMWVPMRVETEWSRSSHNNGGIELH